MNYNTAQSLGYEDPEAKRIAAQLWQIITPPQAPLASFSSEPTLPAAAAEADNDNTLKQEAEAPSEGDSRSSKEESERWSKRNIRSRANPYKGKNEK
jgi:hypothetical protein